MILDLHLHSKYSYDSLITPRRIVKIAKHKGLDGIAITDHDTIIGGVEANRLNNDPDFLVIIGAEICTDAGDIIGLFLRREIVSRKAKEVIDEIHEQGGIVVLPHPYKHHRLSDTLIENCDLIEIFNGRTGADLNSKAGDLAKSSGKPGICGSDAHCGSEIGVCRITTGSRDVRNDLLNGNFTLHYETSPVFFESISQLIKIIKQRRYASLPRRITSVAKHYIIHRLRPMRNKHI